MHKNGPIGIFFCEKNHFFLFFVCILNTFPYICVRNSTLFNNKTLFNQQNYEQDRIN